MPSRILVVGCGYLGARAAFRLREEGCEVTAVSRSAEALARFADAGIPTLQADVTRPESLAALPVCDGVVSAVGVTPAEENRETLRRTIVDGLSATLDTTQKHSPRIVFISTTSVYGEHAGRWVDENTPCEPKTDSASVFFEAEELLRHRCGRRGVVLRMAGIYGPGRIERRLEQLRTSVPIYNSPDAVLNLIHIDDAVLAVVAAIRHENPPSVVNVADGAPVTLREYLGEIAQLIGAPSPIFGADLVSERASRSGLKRVSNELLRNALGVKFLYPSYREGLPATIAR